MTLNEFKAQASDISERLGLGKRFRAMRDGHAAMRLAVRIKEATGRVVIVKVDGTVRLHRQEGSLSKRERKALRDNGVVYCKVRKAWGVV